MNNNPDNIIPCRDCVIKWQKNDDSNIYTIIRVNEVIWDKEEKDFLVYGDILDSTVQKNNSSGPLCWTWFKRNNKYGVWSKINWPNKYDLLKKMLMHD